MNMLGTHLRSSLLGVATALALASGAGASQVTINFSGVASEVFPLGLPDQAYSGDIVFNSDAAPGPLGSGYFAVYPLEAYSISVNGSVVDSGGAGPMSFITVGAEADPGSPSDVAFETAGNSELYLEGTPYRDAGGRPGLPVTADYTYANFSLGDGLFQGQPTTLSFDVAAAPEPGAWVLMLSGIGLLGGLLRVATARRREEQATA